MEDCLKLLKGERDEQRLAGLLLATKFCKGDDHASVRRVYEAVGSQFLDRLLKTGMGIGVVGSVETDDRDAYLQLSVTVLASISRVPEIACSKDMVSKIPFILDILKKGSSPSVINECYEFLFLVSTASEDGFAILQESGGMHVLASHMSSLPDGSPALELAMRLVQSVLSKLPPDSVYDEYPSELSRMVATIARQFGLLQNALKFEALHILSALLTSKYAAPLHDALRLTSNEIWPTYLRVGIAAILQNRVASTTKFEVLVLAESLISILGDSWLINQRNIPGEKDPLPVDRFLLLVLESSRVEVAVLLNELAYLKYETSKKSLAADAPLKQRNLAIAFSLIENIVKVISNVSEGKGFFFWVFNSYFRFFIFSIRVFNSDSRLSYLQQVTSLRLNSGTVLLSLEKKQTHLVIKMEFYSSSVDFTNGSQARLLISIPSTSKCSGVLLVDSTTKIFVSTNGDYFSYLRF